MTRANRSPHGDLALPARGADERQHREIRAHDEHQQPDRAEEDEQGGAHLAYQALLEEHRLEREAALCIDGAVDSLADRAQLVEGGAHRDAGANARQHAEHVAVLAHARERIRQRDVDVCISRPLTAQRRVAERRRQDSHDRRGYAAQHGRTGTSEYRGIAAKVLQPEASAYHGGGRCAWCVLPFDETATHRRTGAKQLEEVRRYQPERHLLWLGVADGSHRDARGPRGGEAFERACLLAKRDDFRTGDQRLGDVDHLEPVPDAP